jgi:hypothetical protein
MSSPVEKELHYPLMDLYRPWRQRHHCRSTITRSLRLEQGFHAHVSGNQFGIDIALSSLLPKVASECIA